MTTITLKVGATEADIQAALSSLPTGGTLVLPANQTILISKGLKIDAAARSITFDLNGSTLKQAGDISVISVHGKMSSPASAKLGHDAADHLTVSSNLTGVEVGDYVKIMSDNVLPNDHGDTTRLGQAMKVIAVNGSTVTLEGELLYGDLYKTNVRVAEFRSGTVEISNGTVRGDRSHADWTDALIYTRSTVGTHVDNVTVRDGNSMGMNFINTVNALVTQSAAINLKDSTSTGNYGYGVHSSSSINTTVDGFYAEKVRHAVDNNSVGVTANHADASKYGADIGLTATNVVANANTAFAFSWHTEGRLGNYSDSVVFNSHGVVGVRGNEHTVQNISGSGNVRGIQLMEYGYGDGRNNLIDNVHLKETGMYAYSVVNNPVNNVISNSHFEVNATYYKFAPHASLDLVNTTLKSGALPPDETIVGTGGEDRLLGGSGIDAISGAGGRDYIWGGAGADRLTGGAGSDRFAYLSLSEGGDTITDFGSGDVIDVSAIAKQFGWRGDLFAKGYVRFVQSGTDTVVQVDVTGGANSFATLAKLSEVQASTLTAASVSTQIVVTDYAGAPDAVAQESAPIQIVVPDGVAVSDPAASDSSAGQTVEPFADLVGFNVMSGTAVGDQLNGTTAADLIKGGAGNDKLYGNEGDDVLVGGAGADYMNGGSGTNTASYADAATGLIASLSSPSSNTGDAAGDQFSQIRNLTGSSFDDELYGSEGMNVIKGGFGNDRLYGLDGVDTLFGGEGHDALYGGAKNDFLDGGSGNDRLFGGEGYDRLAGGTGSDTFVLDASYTDTFDTITDFASGTDQIALANTGLGSLTTVHFESGTKSMVASPTLIYNEATGAILWDSDGSGSIGALTLGKVNPGLELSMADFLLM